MLAHSDDFAEQGDENSDALEWKPEDYVANELASADIGLYYWSSERKAEVDFILKKESAIIPVEVKAGKTVRSKSLGVYSEKFNPPYSIRLSQRNFGFERNIKSVPLYAAFCLVK